MPDTREQILERLTALVATVPGVSQTFRNRTGISDGARPAIIVLDADEAVDEADLGGSRPSTAPQMVVMTPEVFILVSKRATDIGAELNMLRRRLARRVLTDPALLAQVGANGSIRYAGCGTALAVGRSMEGEMAVSFAFRYVLRPTDMED